MSRGTKKEYINERIIDNINPTTGVTPEQLYNHAKYLLTKIEGHTQLCEDEITTILSDSVINLYKKQVDGVVPNTNYHDFKDYMFRIIKNNFLKQLEKRKYHASLINKFSIQPEYAENELETNNQEKSSYSNLIQLFSEEERMFLQLRMDGYDQREIVKILGITMGILQKTKRIIKSKYLKDFPKKKIKPPPEPKRKRGVRPSTPENEMKKEQSKIYYYKNREKILEKRRNKKK